MIDQRTPGVWVQKKKKLQVQLARKTQILFYLYIIYQLLKQCEKVTRYFMDSSPCYFSQPETASQPWVWFPLSPARLPDEPWTAFKNGTVSIIASSLKMTTTTTTRYALVRVTRRLSDMPLPVPSRWSAVYFYRKIPEGYSRRVEFRSASYRKIQGNMSPGSSFTMALGGGPGIAAVQLGLLRASPEMK